MILSISALRQNLDALINSSGHSASPPPLSHSVMMLTVFFALWKWLY